MNTFRKHAGGSGSDESDANGSGCEEDGEAVMNRILDEARPKVVAKRRFPAANGDQGQNGDGHDGGIQEEPVKKTLEAGKQWAETAMMQTLEEKIGSGSSSTIADLRDRGIETYALKRFDLTKRKRRRPDDISDSIWDEKMEEEEGGDGEKEGKPEKATKADEPGGPTDGMAEDEKKSNADPVADLWDGVDTGAVELPIEEKRRKQWRHQRGGKGNYQRNQHHQFKRFKPDHEGGGGRGGGGYRGGRGGGSKSDKMMLPPEQFVPRRLLAADYNAEKFFNTVLDPEALDEQGLGKALAEALGEKEPALIAKAVEFAGNQVAVQLFVECQEVEKRGGMLTKKGDRRKAPGGVFLQLFNQREEIAEEHKKALFALGSELMTKSGTQPKWWEKRKQKKEAKKAAEPPDIENEDLPTSSELLKPSDLLKNQQQGEGQVPSETAAVKPNELMTCDG